MITWAHEIQDASPSVRPLQQLSHPRPLSILTLFTFGRATSSFRSIGVARGPHGVCQSCHPASPVGAGAAESDLISWWRAGYVFAPRRT